jgi:hydroxyacylglutathione hydrolase
MKELATMFVQACNAFSENTVVLHDGEGGALVFDPGMSTPSEWAEFDASLRARGWAPKAVLMTHAHLDHVLGCAGMVERYGLHPQLLAEDEPTYEMAPRAAELYGVPMEPLPELHPNRLKDGQILTFGTLSLRVHWTPGHAPGHVVFVDDQNQRVVGGDVLFKGSVGRTDLPGGDPATLTKSIERVLFELPDGFEVWPGHGPSTTIGQEKQGNPFVNAAGTGMMQVGG